VDLCASATSLSKNFEADFIAPSITAVK